MLILSRLSAFDYFLLPNIQVPRWILLDQKQEKRSQIRPLHPVPPTSPLRCDNAIGTNTSRSNLVVFCSLTDRQTQMRSCRITFHAGHDVAKLSSSRRRQSVADSNHSQPLASCNVCLSPFPLNFLLPSPPRRWPRPRVFQPFCLLSFSSFVFLFLCVFLFLFFLFFLFTFFQVEAFAKRVASQRDSQPCTDAAPGERLPLSRALSLLLPISYKQ